MSAAPTLAAQLLYGSQANAPRRPGAARWLATRAGRESFRNAASRMVVGYVMRRGGALPQPVYNADGQLLAHAPISSPAVRAASDWRLSAASARLLAHWAEPAAEAEPPLFEPLTVGDLLFAEALAERLESRGEGRRQELAALRAANPLAQLADFDRLPTEPAASGRLALLLAADWLLPYLGDAVVRRWLAIAARARLLERGEQEALNRRWSELLERLFEPWLAAARFEHLTWFVSFYGRWLREAGGLRGILRGVRQGSWEGVGVGAKERFEAGYGRLLKPGLRLTSLAAELRGYGWQRTAAEEYYLGRYARELEPWADELRTLHDELCRVV